MMKIRNTKAAVLFCLSILFLAFQTKAQDVWSLEKCVQHAIENNIQIKQQALNVDHRENQKDQAFYNMFPTANGQLGYDYNFGRSLNFDNTYTQQNSQNKSVYIGSEVTLFGMFSKRNTLKQRSYELEAAMQDLEKARDDVSLNVVSAYLDILFNKELVITAEEQLNVTREQIDYNTKQVEAGNLAKGKLLETQAQEASEELALTKRQNQLELSLINLQQLLELSLSSKFDIVIPNLDDNGFETTLLVAEAVYDKAVLERPEIKSKELTLYSMEKQVEVAKAQLYPTLSMKASYYNNYNAKFRYTDGTSISFRDQFENNRLVNLGLILRVPIFNGLSAKTNWKNSIIQYESGANDLQLEKNNLRKQIQQAHANAVAAMKNYEASEKAVKSAEEAFRYVNEKFNLGIVTPLEYNDSKNKVTNAQSSFIQAKYEYIFRVKILDFYNGKSIVL